MVLASRNAIEIFEHLVKFYNEQYNQSLLYALFMILKLHTTHSVVKFMLAKSFTFIIFIDLNFQIWKYFLPLFHS